jgi:hypothetical protein
MILDLLRQESAQKYQSFLVALLTPQRKLVMEVAGYEKGPPTESPLRFYAATWPGKGISLPIVSTLHTVHNELAAQAQFPVAKLRYGFYASIGEQEQTYPRLDVANFLPVALNLLQQELDFLRIDGTFFSIAMERSQDSILVPRISFFSFFNLHKAIYTMYAISSRDFESAPGRAAIEVELEKTLERFPDWREIQEFEETIHGLQERY